MAPSPGSAQILTIIFLDVDGVLNIGAKDSGSAPLMLGARDVAMALKLQEQGFTGRGSDSVRRLLAVSRSLVGHGEEETRTYRSFANRTDVDVSTILSSRLVALIQAAGQTGQVSVVLTSSWRKPQYRIRRLALEQILSQQLQRAFTFDDVTHMLDREKLAGDRLKVIGDYLQQLRFAPE
ncbi:unnamed protein product, partial [Polarella glacialis]